MIRPSHPFRALLTVVALAGSAVAGLATDGWAGNRPPETAGRPALSDAIAVASQKDGRFVVRMTGGSMLPVFGEGSLGVIERIDAAQLRPGMVAVYRNAAGMTVAHRVVARDSRGWRVRGLNNERVDSTPVTAGNLRGVVYAIFHTAGETDTPSATLAGLPVVLGAPAQ